MLNRCPLNTAYYFKTNIVVQGIVMKLLTCGGDPTIGDESLFNVTVGGCRKLAPKEYFSITLPPNTKFQHPV